MGAKDIFGETRLFSSYRGELQVLNRIVGGVPKNPDVISTWLAVRMELDEPILKELADKTYEEIREETGQEPDRSELAKEIAKAHATGNGFKRIDGQLVYEGRCLKAALRESANIVYPGINFPSKEHAFGKGYKKGLRATLTERVFVREEYLPLGVSEPSETQQRIKHVTTRAGNMSTITVVDVVDKPRLHFTVDVMHDFLSPAEWAMIWGTVEREGIGADRARGDGVCELVSWERVA